MSKYTLEVTSRDGYPAIAAYVDGVFLAAAGIVLAHEGVGEAWVSPTTLVREHAMFFHRGVKRTLPVLAAALGCHRVQALVLYENDTARRWMSRLGFHEEAVLYRYFGRKHAVVCVRFFS